jgi:hypothetical protein
MRRVQKSAIGILRVAITGLVVWHANTGSVVAVDVSSDGRPLTLGSKQTIVEGTYQISPPALQFDQSGAIHLAWFDKQGDHLALRTLRVTDTGEKAIAFTVNPSSTEPAAMHQSPGLATGTGADVYLSWSAPSKTGASPFASQLLLSRSADGGQTFDPPVPVNDDSAAINHSFEHLYSGSDSQVYVTWLDNRDNEKSGAGTFFAASSDGGRTVQKNVKIDGMACPCCRPMVTMDPDGNLWIAWRKTFEGNVRDIVLGHSADGGSSFTTPRLVRQDRWAFPACPHRGPSVGFDRDGRLYVAWYTEGIDEQPRLLFATSDDRGRTFSQPLELHPAVTSLPDQLRMAVHPEGVIVAVWEEVTGVRKRVVMRVSADRGASFGPTLTLSDVAKAETPTLAIDRTGRVAVAWTEHAFPNNRIVLQRARIDLDVLKKDTREK